MAIKATPSARELFKEYAPRFRTVVWKPLGMKSSGDWATKYQFQPKTDAEFQYSSPVTFDIKEAGFMIPFTYDPSKDGTPWKQFTITVLDTLMQGPFAGRTFYVDPCEEDVERHFRQRIQECRHEKIRIKFSHTGDPITGLHIPEDMMAYLDFFVPRGTPELKAIHAAMDLEARHLLLEKRREEPTQIPVLTQALQSALASVPAA